MSLENSLNDANKKLYDKLIAAGAEIQFIVEENAESWFMRVRMAHELLHILVDLKGFWSSRHVYKFFNEQNSSFTIEFINAMCNDLAHFKMLDDYIEMGYHVDDFLQKTPKQYFVEGTFVNTGLLLAMHKAGTRKICEDILRITRLVGEAKLFELYKLKDPSTVNGVHPDLVLNPLREIDKELVDGLVQLYIDWNENNTVDNLQFFIRLNLFLQKKGIPTFANCR
jgi:hypothetical protein